jgi:SOS-response transcriptional repressor LexA
VLHRHLTTSGIPTTVAEIHSLMERGRTSDMREFLTSLKDDPFGQRAENALRAAQDSEVYGYPAMIRIAIKAWRIQKEAADGHDKA